VKELKKEREEFEEEFADEMKPIEKKYKALVGITLALEQSNRKLKDYSQTLEDDKKTEAE